MADFIEVAKTSELTEGAMKGVKLDGKDILVALADGKYYAAAGRCPHMQAYLSRGTLKGTIITCPMHGSQFDLKTGKVVRWVAGKGFISSIGRLMSALGLAVKKEKPLAVYEVKVEDNIVKAKIV